MADTLEELAEKTGINADNLIETVDNYNDYCPTPYEEGSEDYDRVISKLNGSYEASSQGADYSNWYSSYG